jgi:hypothetical protein
VARFREGARAGDGFPLNQKLAAQEVFRALVVVAVVVEVQGCIMSTRFFIRGLPAIGLALLAVVACSPEAVADLPTSLPVAGAAVVAPPDDGYSFLGSFIKMVGACFFCLGVFAGGMYLYKRFGGVAVRAGSRRMVILERIAITAKSSITLVSLDGREMLVTSGPDHIRVVPTPHSSKDSFDDSLAMACDEAEVCDDAQ